MGKNTVYDAELKINNWNKIIKVNDQGDTISINVGDNSLIKRFVVLSTDIQNISEELNDLYNKFSDDNLIENLDLLTSKTMEISEKIDSFFGKDTCIKVFKTNTPYIDDVMDFIFQISELIEKFTGEKISNLENIKKKFTDKQKKRKRI